MDPWIFSKLFVQAAMKILNTLGIRFPLFFTRNIFRLMSQKTGAICCLRDSETAKGDAGYQPKACRLLRVEETRKKGFYHYNSRRQSLEHRPQSCPGRLFVSRRPPKEQPSSGAYFVCDSPRWTAPPGGRISTLANTRFFVLTLRDCLVTSWEPRCGREKPTGEKTRLGIYIWLRPHVPKQFLSCIDINLWDHMSEIFHHWETAESSWWCFMCPTLGVGSVARRGPCVWGSWDREEKWLHLPLLILLSLVAWLQWLGSR